MKKIWIILCVLILQSVVIWSWNSIGDGARSVDVEIHIPNESPRQAFDRPVLVAGVWHYVNITLDQGYSNVSIAAWRGDSAVAEEDRDYTNYYEWWSGDGWGGNESYIEVSECAQHDTTYSFYIGLDSRAMSGNWTFNITADNEPKLSKEVFVEKPISGFAMSSGIELKVEPFTAATVSSTPNYLRIKNEGNLPLQAQVRYDKYVERIATSNLPPEGIVTHVMGETKHYVSFNIDTDDWQPQIIEITGAVNATPLYTIPIPASIAFIPAYEQDFPVTLFIGHSGYRLGEMGAGVTFQYRKSLIASWNEKVNLTVYLCGEGEIKFDVSCSNVTLLNVTYEEVERSLPFTILSTNQSEKVVRVHVQATEPNVWGVVHYTLTVNETSHTYDTAVEVGSKPPGVGEEPEGETSLLGMWVVLAVISIVVLYMVITHLMRRRRGR